MSAHFANAEAQGWRFSGLVLIVTNRMCTCGAHHEVPSLWEHFYKEQWLNGETVAASRYMPYKGTFVPQDLEIQTITQNEPIGVCQKCLPDRQVVRLPPLSEFEFARSVAKKAQAVRVVERAAKRAAGKVVPFKSLSEIQF